MMPSGNWRLVVFCLVFLGMGLVSSATAIPTVYIEPESTAVDQGDTLDLSVMINDEVDTISNFQVIIEFDPAILQFVEAFEGSLYTSAGYQSFFSFAEESLGVWEVFQVIFPFDSFVRAPGELAILRFIALSDGTSPIDFLSAVVMDIDRVEFPAVGSIGGYVTVGAGVGVGQGETIPYAWALSAPYPNPTRGATRAWLVKPAALGNESARLSVYDLRGRLVRRLAERSPAGRSEMIWDGRDDRGVEAPSGVYFFRLETGRDVISRRLVLVR